MKKGKTPRKPRKTIEKEGKLYTIRGVELSRNHASMTEAQFWSYILSALRRATKYWKPKMAKLHEGRRPNESANKRLKWENNCEMCKQWFPESEIEIDHIIPCGGLNGADKLVNWVNKAFVEIEGFQRLCKTCHLGKSKEERQ